MLGVQQPGNSLGEIKKSQLRTAGESDVLGTSDTRDKL